jgi:phosphoserine phosphatase
VTTDELPSWRSGATRDAVEGFLDAVVDVDPEHRVAVFDNDGTLWCERPTYAQFDFFVDRLAAAVAEHPELAGRAEYAAVLSGDPADIGAVGLEAAVLALLELFEGRTPAEYDAAVRTFFDHAHHRTLERPLRSLRYQPMMELLAALRARDVDVFIVSGGGVEFVRAISQPCYGVAPDRVVGTAVRYRYERRGELPTLRRTAELDGVANEGPAKIEAIQRHIGRRPLLAAGNSLGDREMLEYAQAGQPSLALLVDHDDDEREFAYVSEAATITGSEPITEIARREGWVVASMRNDWSAVFPGA